MSSYAFIMHFIYIYIEYIYIYIYIHIAEERERERETHTLPIIPTTNKLLFSGMDYLVCDTD